MTVVAVVVGVVVLDVVEVVVNVVLNVVVSVNVIDVVGVDVTDSVLVVEGVVVGEVVGVVLCFAPLPPVSELHSVLSTKYSRPVKMRALALSISDFQLEKKPVVSKWVTSTVFPAAASAGAAASKYVSTTIIWRLVNCAVRSATARMKFAGTVAKTPCMSVITTTCRVVRGGGGGGAPASCE